MELLRAAWRAIQAYTPLVLTRRRVIVAASLGAAAGVVAVALVALPGGAAPVRAVITGLGIALGMAGQLVMVSTARAIPVPRSVGPVWDRDDALLKKFGRASITEPVPLEHREDLADWGAQAAQGNVPGILGGVPSGLGLVLLIAAPVVTEPASWWFGVLALAPGALLAIPSIIGAGRGQLVYERATAPLP
jgi:hypothetical protein